MIRLDDVHILGFQGTPCLVFRNQSLMQFLARTNADVLHLAARSHGRSHIQQTHAGNLGNKNLATVHFLNAVNYKSRSLFESNPETGHARIGYGDTASLPLLKKYWDDTAAATHHIAIARTTEAGLLRSRVGVSLYKHFFGAEFGCAVKIDRIDRFVRAQSNNTMYALVDGGIDDVASAHDVGLDRFERVVLTGGHLLKCSPVHHNRYAGKSAFQPLRISNISDEIAQAGMIETARPHVMLFQFVATEDDQFFGVVLAQHDFHEFLTERARSTCDQHDLFRPVHLVPRG